MTMGKRLIDAEALHKTLYTKQKWIVHKDGKHNEGFTSDQVHFAIDEQPTIDAVPVKRGEWVEYPYCLCYEGALTEEDIACSSCGAVFNVIDNCTETFKYCPNCGADMRGEDGKTKRKPPQVNPEMVKALQDRIEKQRGEE